MLLPARRASIQGDQYPGGASCAGEPWQGPGASALKVAASLSSSSRSVLPPKSTSSRAVMGASSRGRHGSLLSAGLGGGRAVSLTATEGGKSSRKAARQLQPRRGGQGGGVGMPSLPCKTNCQCCSTILAATCKGNPSFVFRVWLDVKRGARGR